jgi:hypothetical protein
MRDIMSTKKSSTDKANLAKASDGGKFDYTLYGSYGSGLAVQPFWADAIEGTDETGERSRYLGIDGELTSDNPWDCVWLNNVALPGLWDASATPSIQMDVQKPNGFDGAALVSRGYVPAGITLTGRIWTPDQWFEFQQILPTIWTPPNKVAVQDAKKNTGQVQGTQRAIQVEHPGLNAMGIYSLAIKQITPPEKTSDVGVRQIKMIAIQYVAEPAVKKSAIKKTNGSSIPKGAIQKSIEGGGHEANKPPKPSEGPGIHATPKPVPPSQRPH